MQAVEDGDDWDLLARNDGKPTKTLRGARPDGPDRRRRLALRRPGRPVRHDDQPLAHLPGVGADQRLEPVQRVHARRRLGLQPRLAQPDEVPPRGRLASTSTDFEHAVDIVFLAQEIVVGFSSYPTEEIGANANAFRQLGLGYANLGALLMSDGLPYDSDEGRNVAAAITALMTGRAYRARPRSPAAIGPYDGVREEPRAAQRRDADAPRRLLRDRRRPASTRTCSRRRARRVGRGGRARRRARLPQRAGDGARPDRDDQLPDGLRHDRDRARLLAGQVQGAGRRRADDDRQPLGAAGAAHARLHRGGDRPDRGPHRRARARSSAPPA